MRAIALIVVFALSITPAFAQQNCPATPAASTNNTTCANTAFVQKVLQSLFDPLAVAALPVDPAVPFAVVSDGTSGLSWGATVTGGHSTKYLVWWNGTNWTVVGE